MGAEMTVIISPDYPEEGEHYIRIDIKGESFVFKKGDNVFSFGPWVFEITKNEAKDFIDYIKDNF